MRHFEWEGGFNNSLLLKRISECRNVENNGRVSFKAYDYHFWLPILETAIRASPSAEHLKARCITQSLNDASVQLNNCDVFVDRCDKAYRQLSSQAKKKFIALMSMTYSGHPLFGCVADGNAKIEWQSSLKSKFMRTAVEERKKFVAIRKRHGVPDESADITHVLVHVIALDPNHAHILATDSMDCLRGMLNLFVNANRGVNPFSRLSSPHAMNRYRPGPYRSIHDISGKLATETFWYEHRWLHESPSVKYGDTAKFSKTFRGWWSKLQHNPLRSHIRQGLIRYCRALDLHDAEPALLEMWGALEALTGTQRARYGVTVQRVVQLFIDRDEARQVAQHVRLRRNSTVHAARNLDQVQADAILVHAETLASRVLFFCLSEGRRFTGPSELFDFLDLSLDRTMLKRKTALAKFFVEYQGRRPNP